MKKIKNSMTENLTATRVIEVLFGILFICLLILSIFHSRYNDLAPFIVIDLLAAVAVLAGLVLVSRLRLLNTAAHLLDKKGVIYSIFCVLFAFHVALAVSLAINPSDSGWDPQTVYQAAVSLIDSEEKQSGSFGYFQAYPNNLGIVGLMVAWFKLLSFFGIHNYVLASVLLNVIIMNLSFVLVFSIVRKSWGNKVALFTLLIGFVFITLSLWSKTLYTDTIGMIFPIAIVYSAFQFQRLPSRRIILAGVMGILVGAGYLIKPTTVFLAIATVIVGLVYYAPRILSRENLRKALIFVLIATAGFFVAYIPVRSVMIREMRLETINSMPTTSFAMMGLTTVCTPAECRYGAWNLDDALYQSNFGDMDEYKKYTIQEIKHRLQEYGTIGYLSFLVNKAAWVIGDGSFYAYGEGVDAHAPLAFDTPISGVVHSFMHPGGSYYVLFKNILEIFWIIILICLALPLFVSRRETTPYIITLTRVALVGLVVFLLLFEARARYLYLYVPIFILVASYGFSVIISKTHGEKTVLGSVII